MTDDPFGPRTGPDSPGPPEGLAPATFDAVAQDPVATQNPGSPSVESFEAAGSPKPVNQQLRTVIEWIAVAVGALAVALLIKTFLLQAFYIPSGSMEPTLTLGDRVLVNKLSYRLHDINRGDVIVFRKPPGEPGDINDLIKRVVATEGETVAFRDGNVYIDGLLLEEPYLNVDMPSNAKGPIPNCENTPESTRCVVGDGRVFVLGDNRGIQSRQPILRPGRERQCRRPSVSQGLAARRHRLSLTRRSIEFVDDVDEAVDVIAVHRIDADVHEFANLAVVLCVPTERQNTESVKQRGQTALPVPVS